MKSRREILNKISCVEHGDYIPYDVNDILIADYDITKPTLLFADDSSGIAVLFNRLVRRLKLRDYFNVIIVTGNDACIKIIDMLQRNENIDIDFAILDITFGGAVTFQGKNRMFDGIEMAAMLKELDEETSILFLTGHLINEKITPIFVNKIKKIMDDEYEAYVIYKDQSLIQNTNLIKQLIENSRYAEYNQKIFTS